MSHVRDYVASTQASSTSDHQQGAIKASDEKQRLREQVAALQQENDQWRHNFALLQQEVRREHVVMQDLVTMEAEHQKLLSERDQQEKKIKDLLKECKGLRLSVQSLRGALESTERSIHDDMLEKEADAANQERALASVRWECQTLRVALEQEQKRRAVAETNASASKAEVLLCNEMSAHMQNIYREDTTYLRRQNSKLINTVSRPLTHPHEFALRGVMAAAQDDTEQRKRAQIEQHPQDDGSAPLTRAITAVPEPSEEEEAEEEHKVASIIARYESSLDAIEATVEEVLVSLVRWARHASPSQKALAEVWHNATVDAAAPGDLRLPRLAPPETVGHLTIDDIIAYLGGIRFVGSLFAEAALTPAKAPSTPAPPPPETDTTLMTSAVDAKAAPVAPSPQSPGDSLRAAVQSLPSPLSVSERPSRTAPVVLTAASRGSYTYDLERSNLSALNAEVRLQYE